MPQPSPIRTDAAPQAIGPYSQAVILPGAGGGRLLFCSGQLPADPSTGELIPGGVAEQTHQVLRNLAAVLQTAGGDLSRVVKTTVFLRTMDDFAAMNGVYATYFGDVPPARSTVAVAGLPKNASVEIEAVAALD